MGKVQEKTIQDLIDFATKGGISVNFYREKARIDRTYDLPSGFCRAIFI